MERYIQTVCRSIDTISRKETTVLLLLGLQFKKCSLIVAGDHSTAGLTDELFESLGASEPLEGKKKVS